MLSRSSSIHLSRCSRVVLRVFGRYIVTIFEICFDIFSRTLSTYCRHVVDNAPDFLSTYFRGLSRHSVDIFWRLSRHAVDMLSRSASTFCCHSFDCSLDLLSTYFRELSRPAVDILSRTLSTC